MPMGSMRILSIIVDMRRKLIRDATGRFVAIFQPCVGKRLGGIDQLSGTSEIVR